MPECWRTSQRVVCLRVWLPPSTIRPDGPRGLRGRTVWRPGQRHGRPGSESGCPGARGLQGFAAASLARLWPGRLLYCGNMFAAADSCAPSVSRCNLQCCPHSQRTPLFPARVPLPLHASWAPGDRSLARCPRVQKGICPAGGVVRIVRCPSTAPGVKNSDHHPLVCQKQTPTAPATPLAVLRPQTVRRHQLARMSVVHWKDTPTTHEAS